MPQPQRKAEINIHLHPKQYYALETEATETLFGGAAGGGKSFSLRAAAILWASSIPGLQVYLFRRIRDDLIKNHMEGPKGFRALLAPWEAAGFVTIVENEIRWWNGSKIYLCHCQDEKDIYKYQGAEIHVLCCQEDERIRMADGSLRQVKSLKVGDVVMTLRGSRRLTMVGTRRLDNCVSATVRNGTHQIIGRQMHSATHAVLHACGTWISFLESIQRRVADKFESQSFLSSHTVLPPLDSQALDRQRNATPPQSPLDHQYWTASAACMVREVWGKDCASSERTRLVGPPPSSRCEFPVILHSRSARLAAENASPDIAAGEWSCVESASALEGSLDGCRAYHRSRDEPVLSDQESDPDDAQQPIGAAEQSPRCLPADEPGKVPSHSHDHHASYSHPYTGERLQAEEETEIGSCEMVPCGKQWVIDITVEGENHYITECGLLNKNCVDELTHFTEAMYRFLRNRVRMVGIKLPEKWKGRFPRILCGGNPGNIGHLFVKATFIDGAEPMAIRQMPANEGGMRRQFIPSRLEDNPSMAEDDPGYEQRLEGLGSPELVKAMRWGDWNVIEGAYFPEFSTAKHVIRPVILPAHWTRAKAFDWGSARPFACGWWTFATEDFIHPQGFVIPKGAAIMYREWYGASAPNVGLKMTAEEVAQGIMQRQPMDEKIHYAVADPAIFSQDGGPSLAERMWNAGHRPAWQRADNKRVGTLGHMGGWDLVRARLKGEDYGTPQWTPMLYIFSTCLDFIRTFPALQHDQHRPEDVDTDNEDHSPDQARYLCSSRPWLSKPPVVQKIAGIQQMTMNDVWKLGAPKSGGSGRI